jgi:hypothetical protein
MIAAESGALSISSDLTREYQKQTGATVAEGMRQDPAPVRLNFSSKQWLNRGVPPSHPPAGSDKILRRTVGISQPRSVSADGAVDRYIRGTSSSNSGNSRKPVRENSPGIPFASLISDYHNLLGFLGLESSPIREFSCPLEQLGSMEHASVGAIALKPEDRLSQNAIDLTCREAKKVALRFNFMQSGVWRSGGPHQPRDLYSE